MPRHPSTITGAAGEHLVAARLAAMGYVVALTRGGSPSADLLVSTQSATKSVAIQVKTATWAGRWFKRKPENNRWEWPMQKKAASGASDGFFYAVVDLQNWPEDDGQPQVFIIPSKVVAEEIQKTIDANWGRTFLWLPEAKRDDYLEKWDRVEKALGPPAG